MTKPPFQTWFETNGRYKCTTMPPAAVTAHCRSYLDEFQENKQRSRILLPFYGLIELAKSAHRANDQQPLKWRSRNCECTSETAGQVRGLTTPVTPVVPLPNVTAPARGDCAIPPKMTGHHVMAIRQSWHTTSANPVPMCAAHKTGARIHDAADTRDAIARCHGTQAGGPECVPARAVDHICCRSQMR